jgi:hypothetical protein
MRGVFHYRATRRNPQRRTMLRSNASRRGRAMKIVIVAVTERVASRIRERELGLGRVLTYPERCLVPSPIVS